MDNSQVLNQITNEQEKIVFKGMRTDMESGKALLQPEQLARFLREAKLNTTLLNDAYFDYMKSFKKHFSRTSINGRVLQNGYKANGSTNNDLTKADVKFNYTELDAKKLKAMCEITDDEKDDNLEQSAFEQTLLSMMGERVGEDLEFWGLYSNTSSDNDLLASNDGWLEKADSDNKLDSDTDFDLDNTVEDMFDAMITNMPPRIRQNRTSLKFYVPFEVEDAYRNLLKSRTGNLGDSNQTGFTNLTYKGIPIVHCPTFDAEDAREEYDGNVTSILVNPKQMHWGVWKNLTIEPKRIVEDEITQYYYRMRGDVAFEYPNGIMIANMTEEEAEGIAAASKY